MDRQIKTICSVSANSIEYSMADKTKIKFHISRQMIVTGGLVITVCRLVLLYEARVANSLLGNQKLVVWTAILNLWHSAWGIFSGPRTLRAFA